MAWSSTVPPALAALLGVLEAAPALADPVEVRNGPVVTGSSAQEVVTVGWYGKPDDTLAVEGTLTMEGLAGSPDREQYTIRCAALVLNGAGDMPAAVARAYELANAAGAAIAANRTLGGVVLHAGVASQNLLQDPIPTGARATVQFGVACDAYTGS